MLFCKSLFGDPVLTFPAYEISMIFLGKTVDSRHSERGIEASILVREKEAS